jgi:DNA-nicking Smr family endonuclease
MAKKINITEDDKKAFADAMRGVKRLNHTKTILPALKTQKKSKIMPIHEESDSTFVFSDYEKLELVGTDDRLEFFRSGIQHKIIRNLRKGQYNVEAVLDLHGKTIEEARQILGQFLSYCQRNGMRHVIMIHGKGRENNKPIIKNKLNLWLRQTEQVLGFCSATPKDGSTGALYVLLRRKE